MSLTSDITFDAAKFDPAAISKETEAINRRLQDLTDHGPAWYDIGASQYRQMRLEGKTAFPRPKTLDHGKDIYIPSRVDGELIPCRLFYANNNKSSVKGTIMHIHGGGWVLNSHTMSDTLLAGYADVSGCAVISVGYRLAPEHPFPAAIEDCFDVAEYLVGRSENDYGGPLKFITGESAGAHLALLTAFRLLRTRPSFSLSGGLLLHYGVYDLSILPSGYVHTKAPVLPTSALRRFIDAFAPSHSFQQLKSPSISPLYEDFEEFRGRLPAALFTCGTADPLVDDTILMSFKWGIAGGTAVTKFYVGAIHGFISMESNEAKLCIRETSVWLREKMNTAV